MQPLNYKRLTKITSVIVLAALGYLLFYNQYLTLPTSPVWLDAYLGNPDAQYQTALKYHFGREVEQSNTKALNWYTKAAKSGHAKAQYNLGYMYLNGKGVSKDLEQAIYWYTESANQGLMMAQEGLGRIYSVGSGKVIDYSKALPWLFKAAEQGNPFSLAQLGFMYETGKGVSTDNITALEWYKKGAAAGNSYAQMKLGFAYADGIGNIEIDGPQAVKWLEKASAQNDSYAMAKLGYMYETGHLIGKDMEIAKSWYAQAANLGHKYSINKLNALKQRELPSFQEQLFSAVRGDAASQRAVALAYLYGTVGEKNPDLATKWFSKAIQQHHAGAMADLSLYFYTLHEQHPSAPQLLVSSNLWMVLAKENGLVGSDKFAAQLEKATTDNQRKQAALLASSCQEKGVENCLNGDMDHPQ